MQILKADGTELGKDSHGVKVRLAHVYKLPGQGASDFMKETHALTDGDLEDFARWFTEAGYPTTYTPANVKPVS